MARLVVLPVAFMLYLNLLATDWFTMSTRILLPLTPVIVLALVGVSRPFSKIIRSLKLPLAYIFTVVFALPPVLFTDMRTEFEVAVNVVFAGPPAMTVPLLVLSVLVQD